MALPEWPSTLPSKPLLDGFAIPEAHVPNLVTEFDAGFKRSRPRATVRRRVYQVDWHFTSSELSTFETFYHNTLVRGSMQFTMSVPDTTGYQTRTCKFAEPYTIAPMGMNWRVSALIHVWD